jgi:transcriptional antiterminator RfaH
MSLHASQANAECAQWYLIQCKGGESFRATEQLENQGYHVFHPVLAVQRKRRGKLAWVTEPLFPHYLFIRLDQVASNWRPIRSTRGVLKLVTFGDQPAVVPEHIVDTLYQHLVEKETQQEAYFHVGDAVEVTEGAFKGQLAQLTELKGQDRALLLLTLLNRPQQVEIPIAHLQKQ